MVAMMWLVTGALTPIFGVVIDHLGHRSTCVMIYFYNIEYINGTDVYGCSYLSLSILTLCGIDVFGNSFSPSFRYYLDRNNICCASRSIW